MKFNRIALISLTMGSAWAEKTASPKPFISDQITFKFDCSPKRGYCSLIDIHPKQYNDPSIKKALKKVIKNLYQCDPYFKHETLHDYPLECFLNIPQVKKAAEFEVGNNNKQIYTYSTTLAELNAIK